MFNLFSLINKYTKYASLRSDMADRIMYSTIPHFDPNKMYSTDMVALERAVSGAKNIICHGTFVCQAECWNYKGDSKLIPKKTLIPTEVTNNNIMIFIAMLNAMEGLFNDEEKWDSYMGGPRWGVIAKTLKEIAINYKNYLRAKDNDSKIEAGKKVIVYLNVLDGLAHNTGSIMSKLLIREIDSDKTGLTRDDYKQELDKITKLMDVKELEDPEDVASLVHTQLTNPLAYKDYVNKVKQNRFKYFTPEKEEQVEEDLVNVRRKKIAKNNLSQLIEYFEENASYQISNAGNNISEKQYVLSTFVSRLTKALDFGKTASENVKQSVMQVIDTLNKQMAVKTKDVDLQAAYTMTATALHNLLQAI